MDPLVSIIIPAYNASKYIKTTLDSLLAQTWKSLEIIVINDGSTDDTFSVVGSYRDSRIKVLNQINKGQDAANNNGYLHSKGKYIKFMDSDDLLNPEMIESQIKVLNGSETFIAYGEWARFYNNKPENADFSPLSYWKDMPALDFLTSDPSGIMLQCGIILIPRKLIEKAGIWDERLILFNDTEFFTRILLSSDGVKFSKGARLYYRSGIPSSISAGRSRKHFESTLLATKLIAKHLLAVEDSYRIRNVITNTFLSQYYIMYPKFSDLVKDYEKQICLYGNGSLLPDGGTIFKILSRLTGWKMARRIQCFFYNAGYKPVHPALKEITRSTR